MQALWIFLCTCHGVFVTAAVILSLAGTAMQRFFCAHPQKHRRGFGNIHCREITPH